MKFNGKKVRELREAAGMTQQQLADQMMRSKQYVSNLELGLCSPSLHLLSGLSRLFNVEIVVFFSDDNKKAS